MDPQRDAAVERLSETYSGDLLEITGLFDLDDKGYGYIRAKGYLPSAQDVYVPVNKAKQLGLRKGDIVTASYRPALPQEKFAAIVSIDQVAGVHPDVARLRPKFEELTPLFPDVRLRLETPGETGNMVSRIVDLISPIGKGQRGLIVSPPKAGKTTIMKQIAVSIERNNPEVHLMVLLVDERPEEVTDMRRTVKTAEVVASTFDRPGDEHTTLAELAIERAKRLVEAGKDVFIILDGITRLARAYNLAAPATGRIMSGGLDAGALYPPKKFFGAARNVEEGGSLTILATALIETGSLMDNVIFEEFKGTGNMELRLDRRLAEKRIFPAINVNESSTRHDELLFDEAPVGGGHPFAPGADRSRSGRLGREGPRDLDGAPEDDGKQRRVPRRDRQGATDTGVRRRRSRPGLRATQVSAQSRVCVRVHHEVYAYTDAAFRVRSDVPPTATGRALT